MTLRMRSSILLMPLAAVLALYATTPAVSAGTQGDTKSIFISALDPEGKPVLDLKLGEVLIREDTSDREVVSVKPATQPLSVAILADTSKAAATGGFSAGNSAGELIRDVRAAASAIAETILAKSPESQVMLMQFGQASVMTVPFTSNLADVQKGIGRLVPDPKGASVLLEAIMETGREMQKRPTPRRHIISLNIEPGDEQSREPPNKIMQQLRDSGASIWSVSLQKGDNKNASRDLVLNGLTKQTGGKREYIVGQSALVGIVTGFSNALLNQFEITYRRPANATPPQVVLVGTMRPGMQVLTSKFAPK
jgi:hypothetical protein